MAWHYCFPTGFAPILVAGLRNYGDVFIFIGSNRRLMKLLHAEDGGMVMYVKRLEAGFQTTPIRPRNKQLSHEMAGSCDDG